MSSISLSSTLKPETLLFVLKNVCASFKFIKARPASYSYIPESKIPEILKRFNLGIIPAAEKFDLDEIIAILSPTETPKYLARSVPIKILYCPALRRYAPELIFVFISFTSFSISGNIPLTMTPLFLLPTEIIAWSATYGETPLISILLAIVSFVCCQLLRSFPGFVISM